MSKPTPKAVSFYSKFREHRIIKEPATRTLVGTQMVHSRSISAQFIDGNYTTDDQEMIDYLRKRWDFGINFFEKEADLTSSENEATPQTPAAPETPPVVTPPKKKSARKATTSADVDAEMEGA